MVLARLSVFGQFFTFDGKNTSMKKLTLILMGATLLALACQNNEASSDAAQNTNSAVAQPAKAEQPNQASENTTNEPEIGKRSFNQPRRSSETLELQFADHSVESGAEVCVPVQAKGFKRLLSNQYTVQWNPKVLKFKEVKDFGLPRLSQQNFGLPRASEGLLPFVWIDQSLQGVTLEDGSTVYSICFEAIGQSGQQSRITLVEEPTPFEVVTIKEEIQELKPGAGTITIQ